MIDLQAADHLLRGLAKRRGRRCISDLTIIIIGSELKPSSSYHFVCITI